MDDRQIIEQAYAGQLKALFDTFTARMSGDDAGAEAHFRAGVAFLRNVRDRALANL